MKCQFCELSALGQTEPALCEKHLDLAVLSEYLSDHNQPVTAETVTELLTMCQANGGLLALEPAEVAGLLSAEFAQGYRVTL